MRLAAIAAGCIVFLFEFAFTSGSFCGIISIGSGQGLFDMKGAIVMDRNYMRISPDKKTTLIRLSGLDEIRKFAAMAVEHDYVITLHSGNYSVNGKSVMGMLSLDFSSPVILAVDQAHADEFFKEAEQYIVSEETDK